MAGPTQNSTGRGIGWALLAALVVAASIAISMAVQFDPERASPPEPPQCGGLYTECCTEWDDNWGPCNDDDCLDQSRFDDDRDHDRGDDRGLFDAEANFADNRRPANC